MLFIPLLDAEFPWKAIFTAIFAVPTPISVSALAVIAIVLLLHLLVPSNARRKAKKRRNRRLPRDHKGRMGMSFDIRWLFSRRRKKGGKD